jgi:hypothetical protein
MKSRHFGGDGDGFLDCLAMRKKVGDGKKRARGGENGIKQERMQAVIANIG